MIIRCDVCRDYEVSGSALAMLQRLDLAERALLLQKAQRFAAPGSRPVITTVTSRKPPINHKSVERFEDEGGTTRAGELSRKKRSGDPKKAK